METTCTRTWGRATNALLESLDIPAIILDSGDIVADANGLALLILEMDRNKLIGRHFFEQDDKGHHFDQLRAALERGRRRSPSEQQSEFSLHVSGREHIYLLKLARIQIEDGTLGTLITLYDVSHQREQQRAYSNLIGTLSEALRTPLTSISLGIELLQRERRDKSKDHIVAALVEDLERLRTLSDDLLNRARHALPSIPMRTIAVDLSEIVNSIARAFILDAKQKEVALHNHVDHGNRLYGDPLKLGWVVSTLVGIAVRCTPSGGSILVSADVSGECIRLSISDSAEAISRNVLEMALENDAQQLVRNFNCERRGFELAIANQIVGAHGGRLLVETSPRCNRFIIDLPYR